jgi:hypothetical protein
MAIAEDNNEIFAGTNNGGLAIEMEIDLTLSHD